ncbi:unnamed protein product [Linum tenue]|uniref:DUF569 domain-containing protein n=1 Tax=Linum tenue TaxID=586396 RepID=A0AAV0HN08_9ROSI|nr:unnamed protein product [Linum tenue]
MEFFTKTKAVKLRSHLDKYLLADDDRHTVRQTRSSASSRRATWFVELLQDHDGAGGAPLIRLRSSFGTYLSASDAPFLLGVTGCKVVQAPAPPPDQNTAAAAACLEWRPVRDGFQVRLQSWCGKYLRGNGGTPPWRNSVTHDDPHTGATQKWIMWDVEAVIGGETESVAEYLSSVSSLSSLSDEMLEAVSEDYKGSSSPRSPITVMPPARTPRLTVIRSFSPKLSDSPRKKVHVFPSFINYLSRRVFLFFFLFCFFPFFFTPNGTNFCVEIAVKLNREKSFSLTSSNLWFSALDAYQDVIYNNCHDICI